MITLRQLEFALAVAKHRHFKRAAEDCNISQSALSLGIAELEKQLDTDYIESKIKNVVYLSAKSGEGRADLVKAVEDIAGMDNFNPSEGVLSNERQRQAVLNSLNSVKDAKNALEIGLTYDAITVSIEEAITSLLELTGERTSDEVVDRVFHNFCVGK